MVINISRYKIYWISTSALTRITTHRANNFGSKVSCSKQSHCTMNILQWSKFKTATFLFVATREGSNTELCSVQDFKIRHDFNLISAFVISMHRGLAYGNKQRLPNHYVSIRTQPDVYKLVNAWFLISCLFHKANNCVRPCSTVSEPSTVTVWKWCSSRSDSLEKLSCLI